MAMPAHRFRDVFPVKSKAAKELFTEERPYLFGKCPVFGCSKKRLVDLFQFAA